LPSCNQRCCTFGDLASKYDAEIEKDESTSGILALRGELAALASGRVLEIAGGTGRNLPYYTSAVRSLLITDNSEPMLQQAAHKVAMGVGKNAALDRSSVTLAVVDASAMALPDASFDTVVDTFGVCSFERPAEAYAHFCLTSLSRCHPFPSATVVPAVCLAVCARCSACAGRAAKSSCWSTASAIGRRSHGGSSIASIVTWSSGGAQLTGMSRGSFGAASTPRLPLWRSSHALCSCYWNRDILKLVRESGLQIREVRRKHFGTTYLITCEAPAAG
jgi:hypothetical protein